MAVCDVAPALFPTSSVTYTSFRAPAAARPSPAPCYRTVGSIGLSPADALGLYAEYQHASKAGGIKRVASGLSAASLLGVAAVSAYLADAELRASLAAKAEGPAAELDAVDGAEVLGFGAGNLVLDVVMLAAVAARAWLRRLHVSRPCAPRCANGNAFMC